jgi:hypothetical protein
MSQIPSGSGILLYNIRTKTYLSNPVKGINGWEAAITASELIPHYLEILNKPKASIKSGDIIKLESRGTVNEKFNKLYSSFRGHCFYDEDSHDPKQLWRIIKHSPKEACEDIVSGDRVMLENVWYPDAYLYEDNSHVGCNYGVGDKWEISVPSTNKSFRV